MRKLDYKMLTLYAYTETMAFPRAEYYPSDGSHVAGTTKRAKMGLDAAGQMTYSRAKDVRIKVD